MTLALAGTALLLPVEKALNGLLDQDPHARGALARFRGKQLAVQTPRAGFHLRFEEQYVRLSPWRPEALPQPVDVTIKGPASELLALLTDPKRPMAGRGIRMEGDAELLLELQGALRSLDIQWQDLLQPILGDVISNSLGDAVAGARDWTRQAGGNIRRNLANYLQYEAGVMPSPEELAAFADRVDALRLRIDRLQARIENLPESDLLQKSG